MADLSPIGFRDSNQFCDTRPVGCGRPTESPANRDLNSLRSRLSLPQLRSPTFGLGADRERGLERAGRGEKGKRREEDVRGVEHRCAYITDQGLEVEGSVY